MDAMSEYLARATIEARTAGPPPAKGSTPPRCLGEEAGTEHVWAGKRHREVENGATTAEGPHRAQPATVSSRGTARLIGRSTPRLRSNSSQYQSTRSTASSASPTASRRDFPTSTSPPWRAGIFASRVRGRTAASPSPVGIGRSLQPGNAARAASIAALTVFGRPRREEPPGCRGRGAIDPIGPSADILPPITFGHARPSTSRRKACIAWSSQSWSGVKWQRYWNGGDARKAPGSLRALNISPDFDMSRGNPKDTSCSRQGHLAML